MWFPVQLELPSVFWFFFCLLVFVFLLAFFQDEVRVVRISSSSMRRVAFAKLEIYKGSINQQVPTSMLETEREVYPKTHGK